MPAFTLHALARLIGRKVHLRGYADSRTRKLLDKGLDHVGKKFCETADTFILALKSNDRELIECEAANLLYIFVVMLKVRGIPLSAIMAELLNRTREPRGSKKAIP